MDEQVRYRRLRLPAQPTGTAFGHVMTFLSGHLARDIMISASLLFSLAIAVYVSVPDFPFKDSPWQLQLWSDPSGWWSEITWIIGFGVFASLSLLFRSWFYLLKPHARQVIRARLCVTFTIVSWLVFVSGFIVYFRPVWSDFHSTIMLDRTGALHGIFYITVAHLGVLATVSGLALASRAVAVVSQRL